MKFQGLPLGPRSFFGFALLALLATGPSFSQEVQNPQRPLVILIAGGSGSGKTTYAKKVLSRYDPKDIGYISIDDFYAPWLQPESDHVKGMVNLDNPSAVEFSLLRKKFTDLADGHETEIPIYDFPTFSRKGFKKVGPFRVVIIEGIFGLHDESLRNRADLKIFIDLDADIRLGRRIVRDMKERNVSPEQTLQWYESFVKPMHDLHVEPSSQYADFVLRGDASDQEVDASLKRIDQEIARRNLPVRLGVTGLGECLTRALAK